MTNLHKGPLVRYSVNHMAEDHGKDNMQNTVTYPNLSNNAQAFLFSCNGHS